MNLAFLSFLFPFASTRWGLDGSRAGGLWAVGDHECNSWTDFRYLPGAHLLPAGWDSVGLWVSPCRLSLPIRQIRSGLLLLRQSGQDEDHAHLQTLQPPACVPEQRGRGLAWGVRSGEDSPRTELQGKRRRTWPGQRHCSQCSHQQRVNRWNYLKRQSSMSEANEWKQHITFWKVSRL